MKIGEYLKYLKDKENLKNENDESTIEELIDKILKIKEIIKDDKNDIKFEIEF